MWVALVQTEEWPNWWRAVKRVELARARRPRRRRRRSRVHLGHRAALHHHLQDDRDPRRADDAARGEARGELDGVGRWTLTPEGDITHVRYDWQVDVTKPWQRALAPVLRPVFAWNHNVVMGWGEDGHPQAARHRRIALDFAPGLAHQPRHAPDPSPYADILDLINIAPAGDEAAVAAVRARDATLTKPPGSLGTLEGLVEHLARWQGKAEPTLDNPMVAIFAGNHGVTDQGVSAFPREVTAQMVANFTDGGAAISQICALHGLNLRVFELALELPTGDITHGPGDGRPRRAPRRSPTAWRRWPAGRTSSASARWASATRRSRPRSIAALFGGTGADWVGRGTGVDDAGLARKAAAVDRGAGAAPRRARRSAGGPRAARRPRDRRRCWARCSRRGISSVR